MLSSRQSINKKVMLGPGSVIWDIFRKIFQLPPERPPSLPRNPPTQKFMDLLRTRGTFAPLCVTVDRSAGHLQIAAFFPQNGHIKLLLISASISQFEAFPGLLS